MPGNPGDRKLLSARTNRKAESVKPNKKAIKGLIFTLEGSERYIIRSGIDVSIAAVLGVEKMPFTSSLDATERGLPLGFSWLSSEKYFSEKNGGWRWKINAGTFSGKGTKPKKIKGEHRDQAVARTIVMLKAWLVVPTP